MLDLISYGEKDMRDGRGKKGEKHSKGGRNRREEKGMKEGKYKHEGERGAWVNAPLAASWGSVLASQKVRCLGQQKK